MIGSQSGINATYFVDERFPTSASSAAEALIPTAGVPKTPMSIAASRGP
ncbi:MAG: hypothetical protein M3450_08380 [Actinomycetota bacterium]|nr:hypothetical protein [Actinomycetota bacterium]